MNSFKQVAALLQMNLAGLPQRLGTSAVTVVGMACVVGVLVAMLSMGTGIRQLSAQNVRADRAIVMSQGAAGGGASNLSKQAALTIVDMPGIKRDVQGQALAAPDAFMATFGRSKADDRRLVMQIFGVAPQYFAVYPEIRLTAGRMFQPGLREMIVGKTRHEQAKGLELGDSIRWRGGDWLVVGHFDAGRSLNLSILADADTIMSAIARNNYNQLHVVLESPASFETLQAAIKANPSVSVELKHEADVMRQTTTGITNILDYASYFIGVVMGLGATLGAINAMYAVVDSRKREIATLRAIGFGHFPIVVSVLVEALALAIPGALLGCLLAWLFFNGNTVNPVGLSFELAVTPALALFGIVWALVMGLIGGLSPAIRAARVPVTTALRAV